MPLNLYLLKREGDVGHDEVRSAVVAAPTAAMARQTAKQFGPGKQSPEAWSPDNASLLKIGTASARVRSGVVHMNVQND